MIPRSEKLLFPQTPNNKVGSYAARVAREDSQKKSRAQKKIFSTDFKNNLLRFNNKIKMAVSEDKDDESIVEIMNMALDEYIEKNITNASYEDLLKGYAYEIPLEKRKRMYPTVESIEVDFRRKQKEEIQTYAKEWIDVIRINLLIGKQTNSIINSKAKTLHIKSQIFEYFIEKYPEVENMPNLKDALIRRINSEVEKIKQQNQQIGE